MQRILLVLPVFLTILFYTSCEPNKFSTEVNETETFVVNDIENLTMKEENEAFTRLLELSRQQKDWSYVVQDENSVVTFTKAPKESFISGLNGIPLNAKMHIKSKVLEEEFHLFNYHVSDKSIKTYDTNGIPFSVVDKIPIFPGCENEEDQRACFNKMMQKHISKNFKYPKEAQERRIQGRVSILFTIGQDGVIKNLRMRGPDSLLEAEVKRIIMRLPDMTPGQHKEKNVDVPFSIPISFKLKADRQGPEIMKRVMDNEMDPIYFIDGKESSKQMLNMLNSDDIESTSVLKGEIAQTTYGEKGKNGVIVITTKKN